MPIQSRTGYRHYLQADLSAHGLKRWHWYYRFNHATLHFQRRLRRTEYILNCWHSRVWAPYKLFLRYRLARHGIKLGFSIPPNIFGPGLVLVHTGTIVVSHFARVGANCHLNVDTCIGEIRGKYPVIGDNAYIAIGAKILGGITLGHDVIVGANAVVNKSFGDGVTLVGVPARSIYQSGAQTRM